MNPTENGKNLNQSITQQKPEALTFKTTQAQWRFINSNAKHPAFFGGWGTGKSLSLIMRAVLLSQESPGNLGAIFRKTYTELRDSTIKDFEKYTGVRVHKTNHEAYIPSTKSVILFRHYDTYDGLKNLNLGWFGIEQGEEMGTMEPFDWLIGRLRRKDVKRRSGFLIANASGHNELWRRWINNPPNSDYEYYQQSTFESLYLPEDFIRSCRDLEKTSPKVFRQFVMCDHDVEDSTEILIPGYMLEAAAKTEGEVAGGRILSVDPARYGDCKSAFTIIGRVDARRWKQEHREAHQGWDTMKVAGRILELNQRYHFEYIVVDENGLGGGVVDRLREVKSEDPSLVLNVVPYNGGSKETLNDVDKKKFSTRRAADGWKLRRYIETGRLIPLLDNEIMTEFATLKYGVKSNGKRFLMSKEEARKKGIRSQDEVDALNMAVSLLEAIPEIEVESNVTRNDEFWERINKDKARLAVARGEDTADMNDGFVEVA